jgi:putative transcriptional regulator
MDQVLDPNFRRTVVLMLHHAEEEGALGLVLNRATDVTLASLCETVDLVWRGDAGERVDWGGPVQPDHGWVLLDEGLLEGPETEDVGGGFSFSRSQNVLRQVAEEPPRHARVFLGYAGWGPGQLEREIAQGSWLVVPASKQLVFETARQELWSASLRSLGIEPATLVSSQGVN